MPTLESSSHESQLEEACQDMVNKVPVCLGLPSFQFIKSYKAQDIWQHMIYKTGDLLFYTHYIYNWHAGHNWKAWQPTDRANNALNSNTSPA